MVVESLSKLHERIFQCCQRCGRDPANIAVIGASKRQGPERIRELIDAGLNNLGENYVQELLEKQETLLNPDKPELHWHFIGHLQSRKVRQLIGRVDWIHSVDRLELVQEIDARAELAGIESRVLIQINTGDEESKGGIPADTAAALIELCNNFSHVKIGGLMTLPPYAEDPEKVRPFFRQLRELRDAINQQAVYKHPLLELSMGMSHDFEIAIEEGATMIRIGTLLFGPRKEPLLTSP